MNLSAEVVKSLAREEVRNDELSRWVVIAEELAVLAEKAVAGLSRAALIVTEEIEPVYGKEVAERVFGVLGFSYGEGKRLSGFLERTARLSERERQALLRTCARVTLKLLGIEDSR